MPEQHHLKNQALAWIESIVRDSDFLVSSRVAPEADWLQAMPEDIADALVRVDAVARDQRITGALLPARVPLDAAVPSVLHDPSGFEAVVSRCAKYPVHPAVVHALLAVALSGEDEQMRNQRLEALQSILKHPQQTFYQPTLFQMSLLKPDWFKNKRSIRPTVRGAADPANKEHGTLVSLQLMQNKLRLNASEFFTHPRVVSLKEAILPEGRSAWENAAKEAFQSRHPLTTSLWAMALGDKDDFWDMVTPGAAMYSPFYTDGEIDALFSNAVAHVAPGYYIRMASGISDIFPLKDDPVLSCMVNPAPLLESPMSLGLLLTIRHWMAHPGSPVGIPSGWFDKQIDRFHVAEMLDAVPSLSAFHGASSKAFSELKVLAEMDRHGKLFADRFNTWVNMLMDEQRRAPAAIDVGSFGFPGGTVLMHHGQRLYRNEHSVSLSSNGISSLASA